MYVTFPAKTQIDKLGLELAWTLKINVPLRSLKTPHDWLIKSTDAIAFRQKVQNDPRAFDKIANAHEYVTLYYNANKAEANFIYNLK